MRFPTFVPMWRVEAMLDRVTEHHAEHTRDLRARVAEAQQNAQQWRAAAIVAQGALAELQRRYAPPEPPPEGDVEQPPSVLDADTKALEALNRQRDAGVGA